MNELCACCAEDDPPDFVCISGERCLQILVALKVEFEASHNGWGNVEWFCWLVKCRCTTVRSEDLLLMLNLFFYLGDFRMRGMLLADLMRLHEFCRCHYVGVFCSGIVFEGVVRF